MIRELTDQTPLKTYTQSNVFMLNTHAEVNIERNCFASMQTAGP